MPEILLLPPINQLEQVSILAEKPQADKRQDKSIVDKSPLAIGESVIDILEISSGVTMYNNQLRPF